MAHGGGTFVAQVMLFLHCKMQCLVLQVQWFWDSKFEGLGALREGGVGELCRNYCIAEVVLRCCMVLEIRPQTQLLPLPCMC